MPDVQGAMWCRQQSREALVEQGVKGDVHVPIIGLCICAFS